jgi:radical SAM superfamily enzyme YgiQ (UPF0313 family)
MFDNQRPNIILLSDLTESAALAKTAGPYKVAHELRNAGYQVAVIHHLHVFSFNEIKHILQNLISDKTLFVGINSMFYQTLKESKPTVDNISFAVASEVTYSVDGTIDYNAKEFGQYLPHGIDKNAEIRSFIKECNPHCKIVLGGPDANDLDYVKEYDYVVTGYADQSMVNLADYLLGSTDKLNKSYRSLHGPTIVNDSKAENFDFPNSTMKYLDQDGILPGETLVIEISRGCIFSCAFCNYPLNGKKKLDYLKNEELLYQEFLDNYTRFGVTRYRFSDDTFNDSREKIEMLHRISKRLPFKLEYWAYLRLDLLTAHMDLVDTLFESGWRAAFFGIESLHPRTSQIIGKSSNRERQIKTLKEIKQRFGDAVAVNASFIFGLPEEPVSSMQETAAWLLSSENPVDTFLVNPLYLYEQRISGFSSEIEKNYEKYGYRVTDTDGPLLNWENQYTNFAQATEMATTVMRGFHSQDNKKINGYPSFDIAGLGFDLEFALNKPQNYFDWNLVYRAKEQRVKQYKEILYKHLNIKPWLTQR